MTKAGIAAAAGGVALVVLLVPIVRKVCVRWKLYDWPGPLKIHRQPIPRLGGIAVTAAILGGALFSVRFSAMGEIPVFAAMILICAVGALDDIYGLSAVVRLAAQMVTGALLWFGCAKFVVFGSSTLGLLAACVFAVAVVNSLNFLDGSDGIASGVAGIIAVGYGVLAWPASDRLALAIAWALAGSCAGFLPFNLPAKIFLGDSGSTVLGLSIAFLGLSFYRSSFAPSAGSRLLFPVVVAGLPLLDMALAIIRRIRGRASPVFGDRKHFYDLLLGRGMPARSVALVCHGVTIVFVLIGSIGEQAAPAVFLLLASLGIGALLIVAIRLGILRQDTPETPKTLAEMNQSPKAS